MAGCRLDINGKENREGQFLKFPETSTTRRESSLSSGYSPAGEHWSRRICKHCDNIVRIGNQSAKNVPFHVISANKFYTHER